MYCCKVQLIISSWKTTQNKFLIIIIINYYPREHISQNVTSVLRDQGEWHLSNR